MYHFARFQKYAHCFPNLERINMQNAESHYYDGPLPAASKSTAEADAVSALVSLGYKPQEASKAIGAIKDKSGLSSEELIRRSLKGMITK